jgi:hypothetical protein
MEENKKKQVIAIGGDRHPETLKRAMTELGDDVELVTFDEPSYIEAYKREVEYQYHMSPQFRELGELYPPTPKSLRGKKVIPVRDSTIDPKIQRNDPCPCGSEKKYKRCCG